MSTYMSGSDGMPLTEAYSYSTKTNAFPAYRGDALQTTPQKSMYSFKKKSDKKSVTVLHAVPENTTTQSYHGVSSTPRITSNITSPMSPPGETVFKFRYRRNTSNTSSAKCPVGQVKGAIGVYKHGKIQWQPKGTTPPEIGSRTIHEKDRRRPKIQLVIPGSRERPLPSLPFFAHPGKHLRATASVGAHNAHDVSPASANSRVVMRDSVVSPLSQYNPMPVGQRQRSKSEVVRKASIRPGRQPKDPYRSGSSLDSIESDPESFYGSPSSSTSVEEEIALAYAEARKYAHHISVINPISAGVFDPSPEEYRNSPYRPPTSPPRRYYRHQPVERDFTSQPSCSVQSHKTSGNLSRRPTFKRKASKRSTKRRSLASSSGVIDQAIGRSTSRQFSTSIRVASPTLSEAEDELEQELTSFAEEPTTVDSCVEGNDQVASSSIESSAFASKQVVEPKTSKGSIGEPIDFAAVGALEIPPEIPRKSSKRRSAAKSRRPERNFNTHNQVSDIVHPPIHRRLTLTIPKNNRVAGETTHLPPQRLVEPRRRVITPACAEAVILQIFHSLDHLKDLFALAVANRGFYRVFKRHELDLVRSTLRKMSPPAWEFREIAFPGHDMLHDEELEMTRPVEEYTPSVYLRLLKCDIHIMMSIKSLIREKCQSIVRPEIATALSCDSPSGMARVDDALWRIWTFCKIFGSGKGREDDIVAQQDWLKGGAMVHQQECTFSIMSTDYMNDTLVGAPECFGKGNEGGLSAEQLFDMMELWNCLGVLLQGFEGRTGQAREYGVLDGTDVHGMDGEAKMLDEWCYHLLTFGLSAILELAGPSQQESPIGFELAAQKGWTSWKPPVHGGSRRYFLKEAASRVYEDRIARKYATHNQRQDSKQQRTKNHKTELAHLRTNGPRLPWVRMSQERPMSEWSTVIGNLTRPHPPTDTPRSRSVLAQELAASIAELPASPTPPPRRTIAQPLLPTPPPSTHSRTSTLQSMPEIPYNHYPVPVSTNPVLRHPSPTHPTPPNHLNTAQHQHPIQHTIFSSQPHENTADKAIYRIVEMGFTHEQAKKALRATDRGDGLRVDVAVEALLREL